MPEHCQHVADFYRRKVIVKRSKRQPCPRLEMKYWDYDFNAYFGR